MQLAASIRVFQNSGRCPKLFLWHLAVWGKCYNFHHLLLPNGSNYSNFQEDKNQQSGIFFDLGFFSGYVREWNAWRIIDPAWETAACLLHLLGVGSFFFFFPLLFISKWNCWVFWIQSAGNTSFSVFSWQFRMNVSSIQVKYIYVYLFLYVDRRRCSFWGVIIL